MQFAFLRRFTLYDYLFLVLLTATILTQFANLQYSLEEAVGESGRDYFIARNIFYEGELPQKGPSVGFMHGLHNSPAYFYVLKIILLVKDDYMFLAQVNFILQILGIVLLYGATRMILDQPAPLLATGLFAFSGAMERLGHMGQVSFMIPFLLVGYFLFAAAYAKKKYLYLLASIGFFILAGAMHLSVFALLPLILLLSVLMLRRWGGHWKHYCGVLMAVLVCFLVLFGTTIQFYFDTQPGPDAVFGERGNVQSFHAIAGLVQNLFLLLPRPIHNAYLVPLAGILTAAYLVLRHSREQKILFLAITGLMVQPVIILSIVQVIIQEPLVIEVYYFTPVIGLVAVFTAILISWTLSGNRTVAVVAVVALLYVIVSPAMKTAQASFMQDNRRDDLRGLTLAANAIKQKVEALQVQEQRSSPHFFWIDTFRTGSQHSSGILFLSVLQEMMHYRFAAVTREGYRVFTGDDYVFLVCLEVRESYADDECVRAFYSGIGVSRDSLPAVLEYLGHYSVIEKIYETKPFTIFLLKKNRL